MHFSSRSKISIFVSFIILLTLVAVLAALGVGVTTASTARRSWYSVKVS